MGNCDSGFYAAIELYSWKGFLKFYFPSSIHSSLIHLNI